MMNNQAEIIERVAGIITNDREVHNADKTAYKIIEALGISWPQIKALQGVVCVDCGGEGGITFVDGKTINADYFGEYVDGIWVPKDCPTCGGKGRIQTHSVYPVEPTEEMVYPTIKNAVICHTCGYDNGCGDPAATYLEIHKIGEVK